MNAFLENANDQVATNVFNSASWDTLRQEANQAIESYNAHTSRRRNWRKPVEAADNLGGFVARRMEFLLALMPCGDYTSLLTGALGLAYNVSSIENVLELSWLRSLSDRFTKERDT
jgi:hypothetical protein